MELTIRLTGTRPMLQHNGRMSNPLDPWTRALKPLTAKTKKTDEDHMAIMSTEARGSCWETDDGLIGLPNSAVWKCLYTAGTAYKLGEAIKRALSFDDTTIPLLIEGREMRCEEWLATDGGIDFRPVVINRKRAMRSRPRIPAGWQSTHKLELMEDVLDPRDLAPVIERAGRLVGIGDWRPNYGRFTAEVV